MKRSELTQAERNKLKGYLGFALRKRAYVFGVDDVLNEDKVGVVVSDKELSENSKSKLRNKLRDTEAFELDNVGELVGNSRVKVVGVTDRSLSEAIINTLTKQLK